MLSILKSGIERKLFVNYMDNTFFFPELNRILQIRENVIGKNIIDAYFRGINMMCFKSSHWGNFSIKNISKANKVAY